MLGLICVTYDRASSVRAIVTVHTGNSELKRRQFTGCWVRYAIYHHVINQKIAAIVYVEWYKGYFG